jgi:hypothetical protein
LYVMNMMATCLVAMKFNTISIVLSDIYDVTTTVVSLSFTVFLISNVLFIFFAVWVLEKYGMSLTFKVCALGITTASWAQYFVMKETNDFYYYLVCQSCIALF